MSGLTPRNLFLLLFVIWGVLEVGMGLLKRAKGVDTRVDDRGTVVLIFGSIGVGVAGGVLLQYLHLAPIPAPPGVLMVLGIGLLIVGIALRWASISELGRFFTMNVAVQSDHRIVRSGPYRWVRHPSYTGLLLAFLGFGFATADWVSLAAVWLPILAAVLYRIQVEERLLIESFGDEYRDYAGTTKRLVPGLF
jgi:protein-S-isoprenylcysteine O-methyltransferase Ste14